MGFPRMLHAGLASNYYARAPLLVAPRALAPIGAIPLKILLGKIPLTGQDITLPCVYVRRFSTLV